METKLALTCALGKRRADAGADIWQHASRQCRYIMVLATAERPATSLNPRATKPRSPVVLP